MADKNKISKTNADQIKNFILKNKKKSKQKKLDKSLDKQGYKPTLETQAGTEVSAFDNANRIRGGLKKGGRIGLRDGSKGCGKATAGKGKAYGQNS